jgi:hypothetical protein
MKRKGMVERFLQCGLEVDFCEHSIYVKKRQSQFASEVTNENEIL